MSAPHSLKTIYVFAVAVMAVGNTPALLRADTLENCDDVIATSIRVDQGHAWRPPFGLDRVGAPFIAHVELVSPQDLGAEYSLVAYRDGREIERHDLTLVRNPSHYASTGLTPTAHIPPSWFAHSPLASIPTEIAAETRCEGRAKQLARHRVALRDIEADVRAWPQRRIHPVDLGTILPQNNWLLITRDQAAVVEVALLSRSRDIPNARLLVAFEDSRPISVSLPLKANERLTRRLQVPVPSHGGDFLNVRLVDGQQELWKKAIRAVIAAKAPESPSFGALETKLRYESPIVTVDPRTGAKLPYTAHEKAWSDQFNDVVVYLPNGSRFVFWRGSNYIPFWAGKFNTGVLYQWAENCSGKLVSHPDGSHDCPEALFDSDLRYSRVRIMETTASRVHVRWDYRLTDVRYEVVGGRTAEDFYFYPDGFGTRVVTVPSEPNAAYQLSEFIVITPPAAYPLEVLPRHLIELLSLDGGIERIEFPVEPISNSFHKEVVKWPPPKLVPPRKEPMVYRVLSHKDDPAAAIYFHPSDPAVPSAYPPFYDQGELVTPAYWGNHWPASRGKWTGWSINDEVHVAPAHTSVAGFSTLDPATGKRDWEVKPLTSGEVLLPDDFGQVRPTSLSSFAWMIAYTDLPAERLRDWGQSFSAPPAMKVAGARLDVPSYSPERRALRLVAEEPAIQIALQPKERTVNPVFEIARASKKLLGVALNNQPLPTDRYAWDGSVLWIDATIGSEGATIGLQFQ